MKDTIKVDDKKAKALTNMLNCYHDMSEYWDEEGNLTKSALNAAKFLAIKDTLKILGINVKQEAGFGCWVEA